MGSYFTLQGRRFSRYATEFGLHPYLAIMGILLGFAILSILLFNRLAYAEYIYVLLCTLVLFLLSEKRRNDFLQQIFDKKGYRKVRWVENILISIVFSIGILFLGNPIWSIVPVGMGFCLSYYNKGGTIGLSIPTPFGKQPFEFLVGFRKWIFLFFGIFVILIISLMVSNYKLGLFCLAITLLMCLDFYSKNEDLYFMWIHTMSPKQFIHNKIRQAILHGLFISSPFLILLCLFYPGYILWTLAVFVLGLLDLVLMVLIKYTAYPSIIQLLQVLVFAAIVLLPILLLPAFPYYYNKAIQNTRNYIS